jgi:hypothetical protein
LQQISDPAALAAILTARLSEDRCFLFAGAGTSARAGLPTWAGYLEWLADIACAYEPLIGELMKKRISNNLLLEAAHFYKSCTDIPVGERYAKLSEPFISGKYDSTRLLPLAALPFSGVVTTNYDRSLHDCFSHGRAAAPLAVELRDPSMRECLYWKDFYIARIHGRAEVPHSLVLDSADYDSLYEDAEYQDFLHHLFTHFRCIFIGFSFLDPAIERLLSYIAAKGVFPKKHVAVVPPSSDGLSAKLARYNIEVIQYDPTNGHDVLWNAISALADNMRTAFVRPGNDLPGGFDTARRLLAVCYTRSKMSGGDVVALRHIVVQGIVLSELQNGENKLSNVVNSLKRYLPLDTSEAETLVSTAIQALEQRSMCMADGNDVCILDHKSSSESPVRVLVDGIIARLMVREKYEVKPEIKTALGSITEEVIVLRGFDLGAEFSGAISTDDIDPLPTIKGAIDRHLPTYWQDRKQQIADSFAELLRHPDATEEAILADLGRISFGIEVVLQSGRAAMYTYSLPEVVYLDASVVLPAIVEGHPHRVPYLGAVGKLRGAAQQAGVATSILMADVFLDEVLNHRRKAIELVKERQLEDEDVLRRRIMFFGADRVNVFVSGYSSWVKTAGFDSSFTTYLSLEAPYETAPQLREFLATKGIDVVNTKPRSEAEVKRQVDTVNLLLAGYDREEIEIGAYSKKALILKKHEAAQLAIMRAALESGRRAVLVTADKLLRRAVAHSSLRDLHDSLLSPRNLIQLIDLLIGIDVDPVSLSRLLWTVKVADERTAIKDYLINRALPHYSAAMLLKMSDLLDGYVDRIVKEARLEHIDILGNRTEQRIATASFMDRVETEVFANLAEEVKKLEAKLRDLERKAGERN